MRIKLSKSSGWIVEIEDINFAPPVYGIDFVISLNPNDAIQAAISSFVKAGLKIRVTNSRKFASDQIILTIGLKHLHEK